jgi:hypothetical protein
VKGLAPAALVSLKDWASSCRTVPVPRLSSAAFSSMLAVFLASKILLGIFPGVVGAESGIYMAMG